MKYCKNCGAPIDDNALFCSNCGTKIEENNEQKTEVKETPNNNVKGQKVPLYEQEVKNFLPFPLGIIGFSLIMWIINGVANTSGILKIMPLLVLVFLSGAFAATSIMRMLQTYKRQMYFKSALSLMLSVLLVTCLIVNFVYLMS